LSLWKEIDFRAEATDERTRESLAQFETVATAATTDPVMQFDATPWPSESERPCGQASAVCTCPSDLKMRSFYGLHHCEECPWRMTEDEYRGVGTPERQG